MKKQTKLHSIKLLSLAIVAAITIIIGATFPVSAQDKPLFKVGDRVEVDPMSMKSWVKGTIVKIHLNYGEINAVEVRVDDEKDYTGAQKVYTTHVNNVRALNETAEEKQTQTTKQAAADKTIGKLRVDANNTVLADREILDCPVEQKSVKNGARPNPQLLSKLIRCIREKPAAEGMDGAVTMDLTPLQIGAGRKWIPLRDMGSGNANTIVYPVKTTYTQKTFYRGRTVVREYVGVFNCHVSTFGEWTCGMAENKQKGETKSIPVK